MIISEHNLIIGTIYSVISDFSISIFFRIEKQFNCILKSFKKIILKIIPISTSPPKLLLS